MASIIAETVISTSNGPEHTTQISRGGPRHRGGTGYRRGRGGIRGRGFRSRGRGRAGIATNEDESVIADGSNRGRGRAFRGFSRREDSSRPSGEHEINEPVENKVETKEDAAALDSSTGDHPEEVTCFICANTIQYYAITQCNHISCHICSLRMRALYETKACAHCRTDTQYVIFSKDSEKRYEEYREDSIVNTDGKLGIKYTDEQILDETKLLLRYNCPQNDCTIACMGWRDLHSHVKTAHHRVMCRLCTYNKKVFTHEHSLFTQQELRKHEREGDDAPGSADQSGFKGHPECGFCWERYYSSDELYVHCRQAHERCHICDRENYTQNYQYYLNYEALVEHFEKAHYPCHEPECLEKKFQVFASPMELKAHQLDVHRGKLTKEEVRDARRIDLSEFEDPRNHQLSRGRGRGRDPNADMGPSRIEMPLRRDELAYQRTLQIQSAQSTTTRTFGGQLTNPLPGAIPTQSRQNQTISAARPPPPPTFDSQFPALLSVGNSQASQLAPATTATPLTPLAVTDELKQARHKAVLERASNLLRNDVKKVEMFKNLVSEYKRSIKSAGELCDAFWTLFATNANELGKLIKELAELYENEQKRTQLLSAWNNWKTLNEDYPPFAGSSSSGSANMAGGSRVLKIKSSTSPSARGQQKAAWGSAALSSSSTPSSSTHFARSTTPSPAGTRGPSIQNLWMPSTASSSSPMPPSSKIQTMPVASVHPIPAAPAAAPAALSSNSRSVILSNVAKTINSVSEFPALPPKKATPAFSLVANAASGGRGTAMQNAWQKSGEGDAAATSGVGSGLNADNVGDEPGGSGKKKKGKVKQTLFHFG